jgi:hypothetical protein
MSSNRKTLLKLVLVLLVLLPAAAHAKLTENPHNKMECGKCHQGTVSFDEVPDDIELTEKGIHALCIGCHKKIKDVHHPEDVTVKEDVPDYLPLGEGGLVTCLTCHEIHSKDVSMHLLRSSSIGFYSSRIDICYECHTDNFKKISPHKSEEEGLSCLICHRNTPTIKDTEETITLVSEDIELMCNFCHNVDMENHPMNAEDSVKYSNVLPLSKSKEVICITCHDPHGTINTISFLREKYVVHIEMGKTEDPHKTSDYFSCLKCHVDIPSEEEYKKCKANEDLILLCYNCHGTDAEKCHPVNIELKEGMELPDNFQLTKNGLISCVTCHGPNCALDTKMEYRNLSQLKSSNCNDCHNFAGFKSIYLHSGFEALTTCYYCHKRDQEIKSFGMSQKFVCLKCHNYKNHPADINHIVKPSYEMMIIPEIKLDKKGKIKCSTCHDPHLEDMKKGKLITFEDMTLCEACHQL